MDQQLPRREFLAAAAASLALPSLLSGSVTETTAVAQGYEHLKKVYGTRGAKYDVSYFVGSNYPLPTAWRVLHGDAYVPKADDHGVMVHALEGMPVRIDTFRVLPSVLGNGWRFTHEEIYKRLLSTSGGWEHRVHLRPLEVRGLRNRVLIWGSGPYYTAVDREWEELSNYLVVTSARWCVAWRFATGTLF